MQPTGIYDIISFSVHSVAIVIVIVPMSYDALFHSTNNNNNNNMLLPRYWTPKYDGFRVFWNAKGKFYLSSGKELLNVPTFITNSLPSIPLDGIFW